MTVSLSPLDSAFLLLETPDTAMNIGAVVELGPDVVGDFEERFNLIGRNIAERLHEIPVLTQRVVRAPFDVTWPILVHDENFELSRHVVRAALPSPGSDAQFDVVVSAILSQPLAPRRPLWQLVVIEGRHDGRAALVLKVHHALADGVSGVEIFANLFDISPVVRASRSLDAFERDESLPKSPWRLLERAVIRLYDNPGLVFAHIASWAGRLTEMSRAVVSLTATRSRTNVVSCSPTVFTARRTSWSGVAGVEKQYHRTRVPLADVKRAAKDRGVSVTDFVMSSVSGAMRRLLEDRGETLRTDLVAFVPINVRGHGGTDQLGNQISGMLVTLHMDVRDCEERLRLISRDALLARGQNRERRAKIFQDLPRVVGPTLIGFGGKVISASNLFNHLPMANVMISSVPGPAVPLWLSGHRVVSAAPFGPLLGPFSLNITALGFEQYLEFGLFGSVARMPDLATLRDYVFEEASVLLGTTPG